MAHTYLLQTEDSQMVMTCTWSVTLVVIMVTMLHGVKLFISGIHSLPLLGIMHVLPITTISIEAVLVSVSDK